MFSAHGNLLSALSEEIAGLAEAVVQSTAIVTGQNKDFDEFSGSARLERGTDPVAIQTSKPTCGCVKLG